MFGLFLLSSQSLWANTEIKPITKTIQRTASVSSFKDIEVKAEVYDIYEYYETVETTWTDWECDYTPPDSSGNWEGFFNVPKASKPEALAKAIKGIGTSRAREIVYSSRGFFQRKPRSWNDFKQEIRRIENEMDAKGIYSEVVIKYGDENRVSLGYGSQGEGDYSCRPVTRTDTALVLRTQSRLVNTLVKRVDILFENSILLSGETEEFTLRWNGQDETVSINTANAFNSYGIEISSRGSIYLLKGEGRKSIRPANDDFVAHFSNDQGKLLLKVQDNRADELTKLSDGNYSLNVSFKLVKPGSWCSSDKVIVTKTVNFKNGRGEVDLNSLMVDVPQSGNKYQVKDLSFERTGTSYFSGTSGNINSDVIKY